LKLLRRSPPDPNQLSLQLDLFTTDEDQRKPSQALQTPQVSPAPPVGTFLRAIGPEPWRAAYVQPSRRPKDGRYGENPNRMQHYYQYQVVLKPAPENILDLYLGSLEALGLDLKTRFRHFRACLGPSTTQSSQLIASMCT